ncbi:unnamed protein product [Leptosia nina]|uniref:Uncharacterized protein n=1 Tax=Leptosia nina TaxID=320188 RepID=A0AAV1JUW6_9NEOP
MMSQHLSSMFEQLGNFTKNNLNSKMKEKDKVNSNHVGNSPHKPPPPPLKKPCKLRNVSSKAESYDTLYGNSQLINMATTVRCINLGLGQFDVVNTKSLLTAG